MGYVLLHSGQTSAKRLLKRVQDCSGVESVNPVASQDVVIRWGNLEGDDRIASWTLNPRQAIENSINRTRMLRILKQNGVYTPAVSSGYEKRPDVAKEVTLDSGKKVKVVRHYRIPIFDMQPLSVFRADSRALWLDGGVSRAKEKFREVPFHEDVYAERAVRLALHALHALGLDFGMVSIGITTADRTICLDVTATPKLNGRLLDLFENALQAFITRDRAEERMFDAHGKNPHPFLIGTDLEFMLRSPRGKMVLASKYLPRKGAVGCDDRSLNLDGERFPLAEIRPAPARSPAELLMNIRRAMQEAARLIAAKNVQWVAGSMPFPRFPIGGHIHFSDVPFSSRLVKALDNYVGFPVMMIEASQTAVKRRPKYGFLGDVRHKDHGGFEYRTPGSWLVSPEIAEAVIHLACLVVTHYRFLTDDLFTSPGMQRKFYKAYKSELLPHFERIWRQIENTSTYRDYKSSLQIIPDMVRQGIAWNEAADVRQTWNVQQTLANRPVLIGRRSRGGNATAR
jgi:hypothetical protein